MMKTEKLLNAIGEINDAAIYGAKAQKKLKSRKWVKLASLAACLCLGVITAFAVYNMHMSAPVDGGHSGAGKESSLDTDLNGDSVSGGQTLNDADTSKRDIAQTEKAEYDTAPVYYSSLMVSEGDWNAAALGLSERSMDIRAFDESMLSQDKCCMIIEGTIVDCYVKQYAYDVYSDKFEENGILHGRTNTVVYEIAVDQTWYGEDISKETIFVEDIFYFTEPVLAVKKGGRYVLPLYEYGESISTGVHEYAGGDITRESRYSTIYPYHPQIEVTNDGYYFISRDWTTLTAKNVREVIMDTLEEENYYQDKMCLVDGNTFSEQMAVLISNLK